MEEEYIVEAILKRRYNEMQKRYEWKVKWEGWDMGNCTWEPIENLEHNTVFLSYMEKQNRSFKVLKKRKTEENNLNQRKKQKRNPQEIINSEEFENTNIQTNQIEKLVLENSIEGKLKPFVRKNIKFNFQQNINKNKQVNQMSKKQIKKLTKISSVIESPIFNRVIKDIKRIIKIKNPLTQRLLNMLQMIDTHVELIKTLMYQESHQAQQILCHLLLVGKNPRFKITWQNPLIWFAVSTDNGLFMFYPIDSRVRAEHWLDECTDFSIPIIPVSKQKFLELTENGKTLVTYATGYNLANKNFIMSFEHDQYPGFVFAQINQEAAKKFLINETELPDDLSIFLSQWQAINGNRLTKCLRGEIARFILKFKVHGFDPEIAKYAPIDHI